MLEYEKHNPFYEKMKILENDNDSIQNVKYDAKTYPLHKDSLRNDNSFWNVKYDCQNMLVIHVYGN